MPSWEIDPLLHILNGFLQNRKKKKKTSHTIMTSEWASKVKRKGGEKKVEEKWAVEITLEMLYLKYPEGISVGNVTDKELPCDSVKESAWSSGFNVSMYESLFSTLFIGSKITYCGSLWGWLRYFTHGKLKDY